ncbi:hypothetical protein [Glaciibacter psychrotolerans]|uniref:Uncharacterized protein n=1 Tax=Glaciibacter psychrotolerans TaxID=670054 RepID=A0A7Z0EFZ7_9MICO|nr:hypothetical protein [Leifsonia psychrotolerans]NYJ20949.1 hypothetical protein [Leifsonia psychrotolerans]
MSVTLNVDDEQTPGLNASGQPDPAYAASLGLVPAPNGRRAAAFNMDASIWVLPALPAIIGYLDSAVSHVPRKVLQQA